MIVLNICMGLAFCFWIIFLWRRRRFYKLMFQVDGPTGIPLLGIVYKFRNLGDVFKDYVESSQKYKSPYLAWIGTLPVLMASDPITTQDILTSPNCVNKSLLYSVITDVIGLGLITSPNPRWALHRKWLNMAFSPANLRSFQPIFNVKTKFFLKKFQYTYNGEPMDIYNSLLKLTMNIALETTMGLENDPSREETEERLFNYYHCLEKQVMNMLFMPWLRLSFVQKRLASMKDYASSAKGLQSYFKDLIRQKLEYSSANTNETSNKSKKDNIDDGQRPSYPFIDITIDLLKSGKFTKQDVQDHCSTIVAGAFETSASTVYCAILMLSIHPEYQQIAFEEIASLYPDPNDVTVAEEDFKHMVYLDLVLQETMRLFPTIPVIARAVASDTKLSSGIVLPPDLQVVINLFDMHRNEEYWGPNAAKFNPENFLPENVKSRHPYAYIPFTKGIRTCIGMRYGNNLTKTLLALILRKYRFSTDGCVEQITIEPTISIRLVNAPLVQFHLREN